MKNKLIEKDVRMILSNLLNECLESMNQENSFAITNIDLDKMKMSVDFDIVVVEEEKYDYIGFNGY